MLLFSGDIDHLSPFYVKGLLIEGWAGTGDIILYQIIVIRLIILMKND